MSEVGAAARIFAYRRALWMLAVRHLKVRYRRSVLGFAWSLAYPALATWILTLVFAGVFEGVERYAVYAGSGVLVWHFFSISCLQATDALLGAAPLLRKIFVPSALFPFSAVAANLLNFVTCVAIFWAVLFAVGAVPGVRLGGLVYGLVVLVVFTSGMALGLAAANVFFHDVRYLFEALLLVWFYATPVVYPAEVLTGGAAWVLSLNPLAWILPLLRSALQAGAPASTSCYVVSGVAAALTFALGWRFYAAAEKRFHHYL